MPKLPTLGIEGGPLCHRIQVKRSPRWLLELRREDRTQNLHPAKYAEIYRLVNQITGVTSFFTFSRELLLQSYIRLLSRLFWLGWLTYQL